MDHINTQQVRDAIAGFLHAQLTKKLDGIDDPVKINELNRQYSQDHWMEKAATTMAVGLKFGTHISKGVHPNSKGNNVNFQRASALPEGIVGSQTLGRLDIDSNGNAAYLPLAAFFNIWIDESAGIRLRDLILNQSPAITNVFADDSRRSNQYFQAFKKCLEGSQETPATSEINKQLLWPCKADASNHHAYVTLIPLHPSALTSAFYWRINKLRYSDSNKEAKSNRYKKNAEQQPFLVIKELAVRKLGGTKPQNISQLTSGQGGRNLLLPSQPPKQITSTGFTIRPNDKSFFNNSLRYYCSLGLNNLFSAIDSPKNTIDERTKRIAALDLILGQVLDLAESIQRQYKPGWSKDSSLNMSEKCWLDPGRAELDGEEDFADEAEKSDWIRFVESRFSLWLNGILRKKYRELKDDFADAEYQEWRKEMRSAIKASKREGRGIFL